MDSLANYGSDGDNSNNSEDTKMPCSKGSASLERRSSDANYDPVQMDMSEESNNNNSSEDSGNHSPAHEHRNSASRRESSRQRTSPTDQRRSDHETNPSSSREDHHRHRGRGEKSRERRRSREGSSRSGRSSYEERRYRSEHARGESRESRRSRDDGRRSSRELEERRRDRKSSSSCREDNWYEDRDRSDHREDRRDRERDRSERSYRRDRDRDRRHSRDDRTKELRHREDRSSREKKEKTRSRSRSKERSSTMQSSFRAAMGRNKLAQLEKLGIELKPPVGEPVVPAIVGEPNYYNPLATATQGKYAEQIQKRKLLWANKSKQEEGKAATTASTANTWMGTTFTHDQDGKVTAKFKRLMGIKDDTPVVPQATGNKPDILKKQEEMFNNMEQQYEVARATTHTQRGVGLGYASGGYQFPR